MSKARESVDNPRGAAPALTEESWGQAAFEWLVLFAACWIFAGTIPPDVGESHYLCKAKRFWDPSFCPGDLFLDSPAPHWLFYVAVGWLTRFVSLEATALIGRMLAFALLAWSWRRLCWAIFRTPWASLLVGGLWLLGLHRLHMAGEWVLGGIEAKSFAYAALFIALERAARGRWGAAWLGFGVASAFHVLVGGWGVVAALLPRALAARSKVAPEAGGVNEWLGLVLGGAIALVGLLPAIGMDAGASSETLAQGRLIYVYVRLEHHLPFHRFAWPLIARHVALLIVAIVTWAIARRDADESREGWDAIAGWCFGSIAIALLGVAIDQSAVFLTKDSLPTIASLLRFYWFRASDMAVPLLFAMAIARLALRRSDRSWLLLGSIVAVAGHLAWTAAEHRAWPIPPAVRPLSVPIEPTSAPGSSKPIEVTDDETNEPTWDSIPRRRDLAATESWWRAWRTMGLWIRQNTPTDAMFLTPPGQQTFKWCAHRAEVVSWKDVPQDARSVLEWHRRVHDVLATETAEVSAELPTGERLKQLANKYGAAYVIVDRTKDPTPPQNAARVYPPMLTAESPFAVYRMNPVDPRRSERGPK